MRKYFFIMLFIFIVSFIFIGCDNGVNLEDAIIKIGEKEYSSLADAISNANDGDTILVYNDVNEIYNCEALSSYHSVKVDNITYVAYDLNKPITIKGVIQNGKRPKVYGSFIIELSDIKYKDNFITVENLEIVHDYISVVDDSFNDKFSAGIRVIEGDANIVDNYVHMSKNISDEIIENNDLQLYYGMLLSRPDNSELSGISFDYDISGNRFGDYINQKGNQFSSAFAIVENVEYVGNFKPSKINTNSYNYSLSIYNKNHHEDKSKIYAFDYDGELNQYYSIITSNKESLDFNKLQLNESRLIFDGDYLSKETFFVDVYGVMIFTGDVENVVFNLKNENAKVVILGDKSNNVKINNYK